MVCCRFSTKEAATEAICSKHGSEIGGFTVKCSWGKEMDPSTTTTSTPGPRPPGPMLPPGGPVRTYRLSAHAIISCLPFLFSVMCSNVWLFNDVGCLKTLIAVLKYFTSFRSSFNIVNYINTRIYKVICDMLTSTNKVIC